MKKRIWYQIKQAGLAMLLAGFVMTSGTQEAFARLPVTEQKDFVERSAKWGKNPEESSGMWINRQSTDRNQECTSDRQKQKSENSLPSEWKEYSKQDEIWEGRIKKQTNLWKEPSADENFILYELEEPADQKSECHTQKGQEAGEAEPYGDEQENDFSDGREQAEEMPSGEEIEEEEPSADDSGNEMPPVTESEHQEPEDSDKEENGDGTEPEEGENTEENPEEKPDAGTEENPEEKPDAGTEENPDEEPEIEDDTEIPEEETADFVLTAKINPETARAGETLVCEITTENTGTLALENLSFFCEQPDSTLTAVLEDQQGEELPWENTGNLLLGEKRNFFICIAVPEDRTEAVSFELTARAEPHRAEKEDDDFGDFSSEEAPETEPDEISRTITVNTEIEALKADFQVTKTADRTAAVPGDRVLFQICIRNTGERTLHSVLTTEKFQTENIPVQFLEKEGVILDSTRTKALVSQILPGQAVSLQAEIMIPEDIKATELINEVEVVTKETGEKIMTSRAEVQIHKAVQAEQEETQGAEPPMGKSYPASTRPKTGDETKGILWCVILLGAAFTFFQAFHSKR